MAAKKSLGEKLAMLAKSTGKSQTNISESLAMPASQLNRFFRGHSDLSSSNMTAVLKELGIDLEEIVSKKISYHTGHEESAGRNLSSSVDFLLNSLDDLGKQTILSQLLWAAKLSKAKFPTDVEKRIKKEISLI